MRLQVLLSVMHQKNFNIVKKANIQTDAIIINQANSFKKEIFSHNGSHIQIITLDERGVGLSRNNALMRSTADIAVFGDEDIEYVDGYKDMILAAFDNSPQADMILFNVPSRNLNRPTYTIRSPGRVRRYNCLKYGAVKMAIRVESFKRENIYFSLLFGGGAKYSSGEDSLFIYNAIKSGLKVFACPKIIGYVSQEDSTWFKGYTNEFFIHKGVFFGVLSPPLAYLLGLQYVIRKFNSFHSEKSRLEALRLINKGITISKGL